MKNLEKYENIWKEECLKSLENIEKPNKVLIMPVGTGFGFKDRRDDLAFGLQHLIYELDPDLIIFIGSDESKKTVESIKKQFVIESLVKNSDYDGEIKFKECFFIDLVDIDNFDECFTKFSQAINIFDESKVIVDYTSGTRTMTIAAGIAATLYNKDLVFVGGERGINHIVDKGTEINLNPVLDKFYDEQRLQLVLNYFNTYRFKSALHSIKSIKIECDDNSSILTKENFLQVNLLKLLIRAYDNWDNFNHEKAFSYFNKFFTLLKANEGVDCDKRVHNFFYNKLKFNSQLNFFAVDKNFEALDNIINGEFVYDRNIYLLASLIENARRKAEFGYYDDAIARLYRATELIGQIELLGWGIDYKHLTVKQNDVIFNSDDWVLTYLNDDGTYHFSGLMNTFKVLNIFKPSNEISKFFKSRNVRSLLDFRSSSILAHGLENKSRIEFNEFYNVVLDFAKLLNPDIGLYLLFVSFPKFDLS